MKRLWNWLRGARTPAPKPPAPRIYATKGEKVTCENGHEICTFSRDVNWGDFFASGDLTDWKQKEPEIGDPEPPCEICGKPFVDHMIFHFASGWRGYDDTPTP